MGAFFVYNDAFAGKCFWTERRSRVTSVFSYDEAYLSREGSWNIDPALTMATGVQPARHGLAGAFLDAAPDRWGKALVRHRYLREARDLKERPRALNEVDYLLGVSDFTRQGDLRFSLEKGGGFVHPSNDCPKLVSLPKLLDASHRYTTEQDESAIDYLLEAGSASLGGARPKAAVSDGEDLFIAKFPHRQDEWDVMAWEWVCLRVAEAAGICAPENKLVKIDGQNVLLVKRFDRAGSGRIGFVSAMTLLGLADGEQADYYEIAEKLRDVSVSAKADLHELYRRIALFVLMNNTDDHLRNHGLLRSGSGWRLSPVFDVNPNPDLTALRCTSVFGETRKEQALDALAKNPTAFDLTGKEAEAILADVKSAVKLSAKYAGQAGIPKTSRDEMLRSFLYSA